MCSRPEILLEPFAGAGADEIIIHVELGEQVASLIWKIRKLGKKVGLAINPPTAIAGVQPYLDQIDLLLVMTVNPGFGGQEFIHETPAQNPAGRGVAARKEIALPHQRGRRNQFPDRRRVRPRRRGYVCERHDLVRRAQSQSRRQKDAPNCQRQRPRARGFEGLRFNRPVCHLPQPNGRFI